MPRDLYAALQVDRRFAERRLRLGARRPHRARQPVRPVDQPHALAPAAGHRLDEQRVADAVRRAGDLVRGQLVGQRAVRPRHDRHAGLPRRLPRRGLAPHQRDDVGRRPDEPQARGAAGAREVRVLRQEPVAGVHRIRAGAARRGNQLVDVQVALGRPVGAQVDRLVGVAHVGRQPIARRVHGDARDAHVAARAHDPDGDLSPVGDQNFHGRSTQVMEQVTGECCRASSGGWCRACPPGRAARRSAGAWWSAAR